MGERRLLRRRALVRDVLAAGRRSSAPFWATARDAFFRPRRLAGFRSQEQHGSGARACCLAPIPLPPVPPCCTLSAGVRHADDTESGVGRPFGYPPSHPRRCASQGGAAEARPQVCSPRTRLEPPSACAHFHLVRLSPLELVVAGGMPRRRWATAVVALGTAVAGRAAARWRRYVTPSRAHLRGTALETVHLGREAVRTAVWAGPVARANLLSRLHHAHRNHSWHVLNPRLHSPALHRRRNNQINAPSSLRRVSRCAYFASRFGIGGPPRERFDASHALHRCYAPKGHGRRETRCHRVLAWRRVRKANEHSGCAVA